MLAMVYALSKHFNVVKMVYNKEEKQTIAIILKIIFLGIICLIRRLDILKKMNYVLFLKVFKLISYYEYDLKLYFNPKF